MKTITLVLAGAMLLGFSASAQDVKVDASALPKDASKFIAQYFPDANISRVNRDDDGSYEVKLNNATEIEFNRNGTWHEVDGKGKAIATTFVPANIMDYVKAHFAKETVTKIEHDARGYDLDLSNGTELEFDSAGKFIRIDR